MLLESKNISKHCLKKFSKLPCAMSKLSRYIPHHKHVWQSTASIRSRFIDYFLRHHHKYIEPCSLKSKNIGSYFINSGVSQFREHILGNNSIFTGVDKAVNSQRCVRLGGKKCDLNDIGYDSTHLSYFEMLGNWSFGAYDKQKACTLMWKFLTEELELPSTHLYVTYFGGSEKLGLPPDDETRDIWFNIGIKDSKVLQFGEEHNFWEMGDRSTNPLCGPSTEIHWDYLATLADSNDSRCARCFVNSNSSELAELWNCVFMEYKWTHDGTVLSKLPALIIDTGMGLERLASIIQGVSGVFDTDSFKDITDHLAILSNCSPYQGTFTLGMESPISQRLHVTATKEKQKDNSLRQDIAYRIISDHLRAFCLCVNDGIPPGRECNELKIRQLLQRAIRQSRFGLGMTGGLSPLVDTICRSVNEWQKIDPIVYDRIKKLIIKEEKSFLPKLDLYEKSFNNFICQRNSDNREISEAELCLLLEGEFGQKISLDMIRAMIRDSSLVIPDNIVCNDQIDVAKSKMNKPIYISGTNMLVNRNIKITDISPAYIYKYNKNLSIYEVPDLETSVLALISISSLDNTPCTDISSIDGKTSEFGLLTSCSNMFPTKGGQDCDKGVILSEENKEIIATINNVTELDTGHIVHWCTMSKSSTMIHVADKIHMRVDNNHRTGTTLHHTAHHIVFGVLNKLFGRINQSSSYVKADHAKLGFSIDITHGNSEDILSTGLSEKIEKLCLHIIKNDLPVEKKEKIKFSQISQDSSIRYLNSENLPSEVRLISIEDMNEVCCGTHAENTGHLQDIVITSLKRTNQAIAEISFVVGETAIKVRQQDEYLRNICMKVDQMTIDCREEIDNIVKILKHAFGYNIMSKTTRDIVSGSINTALKYKNEAPSISDLLKTLFSTKTPKFDDVHTLKVYLMSVKKAVKTILDLKVSVPVIMYDENQVLIFSLQKNLSDNVHEYLLDFLKSSNYSISDIIIESPKIKNVTNHILRQFISIKLPEQFHESEKLVLNLKKLIKKHL